MKALFLDAPGQLRLANWEDPETHPHQIRLRIQAVTVCGSDLHYYKEGAIGSARVLEPLILGHEFSGVVDDLSGELYGFPQGTLVAVDPANPCGHCEWCHRGEENLCPNVKFAGSAPIHGAMRQVFYARPQSLFKLPPGFGATDAALLEPLGVAIHAVDLAKIRLGASVAVVGAGAIGLLMVQVARVAGAGEIHVLEPLEYRRTLARGLGADAVHATGSALLEATGGRGLDVVLEATDTPEGPEAACQVARIGGKVVLVGIPDGDQFSLTASNVRRKGLSIKLSRRMGQVYPRAIALVAKGLVNVKAIATHYFSLERASEAFRLQAARTDGIIKSVIQIEKSS